MISDPDLKRRQLLIGGAGVALATVIAKLAGPAHAGANAVTTDVFPYIDEYLSDAGLGTIVVFDIGARPGETLVAQRVSQALIVGGGQLIDRARSYSHAKDRLTRLVADLGIEETLFFAAKSSCRTGCAAGTDSPQNTLRARAMDRIEIAQTAIVGDPGNTFSSSGTGDKQGLFRYVGMSTNSDRQQAAIAKAIKFENARFPWINPALPAHVTEHRFLSSAMTARAALHVELPLKQDSFSILDCAVLGALQLSRAVNGGPEQNSGDWNLIATSFA